MINFAKVKLLLACQPVRFLIVGAINTIVGYGCFAVMLYAGLPYLSAYWISMSIGVAISYILNKLFTFKSRARSILELIRFLTVYAASFVVGTMALFMLVDILSITPYAAGGINLIFTTLTSWFGHKYFSFKEGAKNAEDKRAHSFI